MEAARAAAAAAADGAAEAAEAAEAAAPSLEEAVGSGALLVAGVTAGGGACWLALWCEC